METTPRNGTKPSPNGSTTRYSQLGEAHRNLSSDSWKLEVIGSIPIRSTQKDL